MENIRATYLKRHPSLFKPLGFITLITARGWGGGDSYQFQLTQHINIYARALKQGRNFIIEHMYIYVYVQ